MATPEEIHRQKQEMRRPISYEPASAVEELRRAEEDGTLPEASMARLRIRAGTEQQARQQEG